MILGLLSLTLLATLNMVSTQRAIVARTQKWNIAIPMSEAGIEDAMAHLNYGGTTNLGSDGWTLTTNGTYFRSNSLGSSGYYSVTISTATPPVIVSQGYILDPVKSNYLIRTVQVNTKVNGPFPAAILAKGSISMSGGAKIDSFNSTNTTYSTGGVYDPTKAESNAKVETDGGLISVGTGKIYGTADTGPGGSVTVGGSGGVGDSTYLSSSSGIQSGHALADVNTIIPDVTSPDQTGATSPASGAYNGTNYSYVLRGTGSYSLPANFNLSGGNGICISGNCTLFATSGFQLSGGAYIYIAPGASLQLYIGGSGSISGGGIINSTTTASSCQIWGLPTCTSLSYSGGAGFIGTVYAPEAAFSMTGNSDASGAVVSKSVTMSGGMNFHYDEALGGPVGYKYLASSWQEL